MSARFAVATLAVVLIASPITLFAQSSDDAHHPAAASKASPPPAGMAEMMKRHEHMMAAMKSDDQTLAALVIKMNKETGSAKVDAIAAVINELVRRQTEMSVQMWRMQMTMKMMEAQSPLIGGEHQH